MKQSSSNQGLAPLILILVIAGVVVVGGVSYQVYQVTQNTASENIIAGYPANDVIIDKPLITETQCQARCQSENNCSVGEPTYNYVDSKCYCTGCYQEREIYQKTTSNINANDEDLVVITNTDIQINSNNAPVNTNTTSTNTNTSTEPPINTNSSSSQTNVNTNTIPTSTNTSQPAEKVDYFNNVTVSSSNTTLGETGHYTFTVTVSENYQGNGVFEVGIVPIDDCPEGVPETACSISFVQAQVQSNEVSSYFSLPSSTGYAFTISLLSPGTYTIVISNVSNPSYDTGRYRAYVDFTDGNVIPAIGSDRIFSESFQYTE